MIAVTYRPLIFMLTWTLILGLISLIVLASAEERTQLSILIPVLVSNAVLLAILIYKERKAIVEEVEQQILP